MNNSEPYDGTEEEAETRTNIIGSTSKKVTTSIFLDPRRIVHDRAICCNPHFGQNSFYCCNCSKPLNLYIDKGLCSTNILLTFKNIILICHIQCILYNVYNTIIIQYNIIHCQCSSLR